MSDADAGTNGRRRGFDYSVLALVGANLVPLGGVLLFGWDAAIILVVYWAENLVVGFYSILKMALARSSVPGGHALKFFLIPFFTVHFGGFCAVHGLFLLLFIQGMGRGHAGGFDPFPDPDAWWGPLIFVGLLVNVVKTVWSTYSHALFWPVVALLVSHGASFVENYLLRGEYRERDVRYQMFAPYGRIVVMHIAIIAAGVPVMLLGSPLPLLVILVVLKIVADVVLHLASHKRGEGGTLAEAKRMLAPGESAT